MIENEEKVVVIDEEIAEPIIGNTFKLNLENFDGPLDFLLELIKVNKVEIRDIFLSEVTEQFMAYLVQLDKLDVDLASEYMAIAATLLEIKSRALLPIETEGDEEEPEEMLLQQLEMHQALFKEIAGELKEQETVNRFYRQPDKSVGVTINVVKEHFSTDRLLDAFNAFLEKAQFRVPKDNSSRAISEELFTVPDRIMYVKSALLENGSINFEQLFACNSSLEEVVTTFSAILEMIKLQVVKVDQPDHFSDFLLLLREDADMSAVDRLVSGGEIE